MKRTLKTIAIGTLVLLSQASSLWACPMCKYALETDENEPRAYMISILFMMGMITALFSGVTVLLWYVSKLERKNLTAAGYQHLFENAGCQPYLVKAKAK